MTRFCSNPACGRGFVTWTKPPQVLCPTCRHSMPVLSRLVGGKPRKAQPEKGKRA